MTPQPPRSSGKADIALLWFACAIALGAGYYLVFAVLGAAIDTQHELTGRLAAVRLTQARTLALRPELEREERAVADRLDTLDLHADKATLAARFIRTVTRIALEHHVNVDGVDERAPTALADPPPASPRPLRGSFAFEPIPLDVALSGSYRALLATISELAQTPVAMQIDIAAIERTAVPAAGGTGNLPLTARLHVVLQHLTDDAPVASAPLAIPEDVTTHARPF